jgi:lipopolysaccharide transport system ATP-binding protein
MNNIAIQVENLAKRYRIGLKEEIPETLIGAATSWLKAPINNFRQLRRLSHFSDNGYDPSDVIWALKDVSFDVQHGEVIGIIGRNGAGKSTLLKILSRITIPTQGRVTINGRVASLLEVGTGFHPDLSGRENVYLNGTILGMTRQEIDRKFDQIVGFSGVEKFIDTPVKRYSSGMQVRLAFAVAAHLEPEILLIDEVLAVGDVEFQKKCLGKMENVVQQGRTVFFVSHNMGAVQALCKRVLWIDKGTIQFDGAASDAIAVYTSSMPTGEKQKISKDRQSFSSQIKIINACVLGTDGEPADTVPVGGAVCFEVEFEAYEEIANPFFIFKIKDQLGLTISSINSFESLGESQRITSGGKVKVWVEDINFVPGVYTCDVILQIYGQSLDWIEGFWYFNVVESLFYPTGKYPNREISLVCLPCQWTLEYE